ncbi:hypothetical protein [Thermoleptolyngbya sp. C42_A2020_037]|nr:hypothetical protein [Thermoleptolyngbya sp. C42_A2020_037]
MTKLRRSRDRDHRRNGKMTRILAQKLAGVKTDITRDVGWDAVT